MPGIRPAPPAPWHVGPAGNRDDSAPPDPTRPEAGGPDTAQSDGVLRRRAGPGAGGGSTRRAPVRLLIVDDSATLRRLLRHALAGDDRIAIVGEARDPYEARDLIRALRPDVLTLDVDMPRMSGLAFLERLMRLHPMPVVMISSETGRGSAAALEALTLGAVDCVGKQTCLAGSGLAMLGDRIVEAAQARTRRLPVTVAAPPRDFVWNGRMVLIGASTGGVEALEVLLAGLPTNGPPVLITQHMPEAFLARFATRLAPRLAPRLALAETGAVLAPGTIWLAPGGATHLVLDPGDPPRCRLKGGATCSGHRPSVDVMFASARPLAARMVAVLLSGMGADGARAMADLRAGGAQCLVQDAESSVVFGMPRAALAIGAADRAVPIAAMAGAILALTGGSGAAALR